MDLAGFSKKNGTAKHAKHPKGGTTVLATHPSQRAKRTPPRSHALQISARSPLRTVLWPASHRALPPPRRYAHARCPDRTMIGRFGCRTPSSAKGNAASHLGGSDGTHQVEALRAC